MRTTSPLDGRVVSKLAGGPRVISGGGVSALKVALLAPLLAADAYRPAMLGREPEAFEHVSGNLEAAMGEPVNMLRIHVGDTGYDFARNLAASGPGTTMLVSSPESRAHFQQGQDVSTVALRSEFSRLHLEVRSLPFAVNFANLCFDRELSMLVLALPAPLEPACSWVHPTLGCDKQVSKLVEAFGAPRNVLKFEPAMLDANECFDLDMFFFMFRNADGEPVALVYSPCIKEVPSSPSAEKSGSVGRAAFKRRLEELGIAVVEVARRDFDRRACNSISPGAGRIVFSEPVSAALRKTLEQLKVTVAVLPEFASAREFGIHCLTLELPELAIQTDL